MHVAIAPEPATDRPVFRRDLALAEARLIDKYGYSENRAAAAIEHIRAHQTTERCSLIDDEHKPAIERLLDTDPAWQDGRWDAERFEADAVLA